MKLTRVFDMTGQPAISIPAGLAANGLPVGIQLVADNGQEELLVAAAKMIEAALC